MQPIFQYVIDTVSDISQYYTTFINTCTGGY